MTENRTTENAKLQGNVLFNQVVAFVHEHWQAHAFEQCGADICYLIHLCDIKEVNELVYASLSILKNDTFCFVLAAVSQYYSLSDSLQGSHVQDEITQGFDMSRTFDLIAAGAFGGQFEAGEVPGGIGSIFEGVGGAPWRRSGGDGGPDDGYVPCPQCQKPITSYNLNRHVKMVHSTMERATCALCNKQFKNKYSLATHVHRQHSEHAPGSVHRQPPPPPPPPPPPACHPIFRHSQTQGQTSQSGQPQPQQQQQQQQQQQHQPQQQRPHPSQNTDHPHQMSPQQRRPRQQQQQQSSGQEPRNLTTVILSPAQHTQPARLQHHPHRVPSPASGATATVMQRPEELVQERH
ncbi:uncharacterized protein LOC143017692 [Oratosquilla oratoria]|uniref:uncharacterized protein LOC143017692 n=1 Tax=Oratosquilla oratoria TaxID=337810 RepID=UPI003F75FE11